jgi:hypothetical protein
MGLYMRKDQCAFVAFPEAGPKRILASEIYTLSLEAKSKLLASAVPFPENYKQHAREILCYLKSMSDDTLGSVFKLKSDDISHIPFRLLNPGRVSTEVEDSYLTLSYCWLSPAKDDLSTATEDESKVESFSLPVSPLLYQALLHERRSSTEGVWIDQVCIDQTSSAEKQIAVNAMDLIYKSARKVIILLDDIEISVAEQDFLASHIIEFEEYQGSEIYQPHFDERPPYMKANPVLRGFFLKLIGAKWFERAWCMHEMRLSPDHVFLIRCEADPKIRDGKKMPPTVLRFTGYFLIHIIGLTIASDLSNFRCRPLVWVFGDAALKKMGSPREIPSYVQVFADVFRQSAGGNPALEPTAREHDANLDKLSIAINTIGLGLSVLRAQPIAKTDEGANALPPATPDECCRRFITLAIAAADPSALCSTGPELRLSNTSRTWMRWPLYTDTGVSSNHMPKLSKFDIDFDTSPAAEYVGLDMCFFNGDGEGSRPRGVRWVSERKLRICRAFKEGCEMRKIYSVNYGYLVYGKKLDRLQLRKATIRTLATIMECGIEWVRFMGKTVLEDWDTQILVDGVQNLLDWEESDSVRMREGHSLDVKHLDSPAGRIEAELLLDLARYLVHMGLPWESERSMSAYEAVCIGDTTADPGCRALIYAQIPDSGSSSEVVCATPMALLSDELSGLFRGWTLVKGSPEKEQDDTGVLKWKFHLVGKSKIFGTLFGGVTGDGEASRNYCGKEIKGVRMYGPEDSHTGRIDNSEGLVAPLKSK